MTTTVLERTEEYTIERADALGVPIFTYNEYLTGERLREVARRWEAIIEATGVERYVVNTEAFMAHEEEDKQWLGETWLPNLIDHGVRAGAGVYADSAISSLDMGRIESTLNAIDPDFEYRTFGSEADALEWIAEQ
ncbi:hypothetical protein [Natrinema versiforme]|uniref:STAS/SEC14 domain-containing protein n=1 Tax=Natrinema versiforme JCM 10478 TaxID=1227496 RepID=L9XRJ1_9EURY|nr:hypothetical protein [Natrinema versiforme]ELY64419.1 hypothetical protein C489_16739 [Natrinema versiforme JCM 10478]